MERARSTLEQARENHRRARAGVDAARATLATAEGSRLEFEVLKRQALALEHKAEEIRGEIRRLNTDIGDLGSPLTHQSITQGRRL